MPYRLLADAVLLAHAAFVAFAALGALSVARWPRLAWLHVPAAAWAAGIEFTGAICPLTPLENRLRALSDREGYEGGFVEHYVFGLLYPAGLTRELQVALGLGVVLLNVAAYAWLWRRHRRAARMTRA